MRMIPLVVGTFALAVMALPGSVPGQDPTETPAPTERVDSSFGAGHVLLTDFTYTSQSGPNGEDPTGTLIVSGYLDFTASLTCSNVSGNTAVGGFRIETGKRAGDGFLTASVDNGPPRDGRPVDETLYSGYLPKPPVNCPSPGDQPPPGFEATGGGPFTSGDWTLVNGRERLPEGTPAARVARLRVRQGLAGVSPRPDRALALRVRICGLPGSALLRLTQTSSPIGRDRPVGVRTRWHAQLRHDRRCATHRVDWPLTRLAGNRRYRVTVSARTTGRAWSKAVVRSVDTR
ncbi:MAG: hypothetical protein QOH58_986 [Thermoleophilaceae bacterium]|jgi:hypothetical protein|nr:hypothetical protein [Thermoleophilaceae bacterium]